MTENPARLYRLHLRNGAILEWPAKNVSMKLHTVTGNLAEFKPRP